MAMTVADVMTRDVVTARPEDWWLTALRRIEDHRVHGLPVVDRDGRVVGVLTQHDLALKEERQGRPGAPALQRPRDRHKAAAVVVRDAMTPEPVVVEEGCDVGQAARLMHRKRVGRLPVVDAEGRLVGIVTRSDLLRVFLRPDEDLAADVRADLAQLDADAGDIDLRVADGVVDIRGCVPTRSTAMQVQRRAEAVPGVVGVRCHLEWRVDDVAVLYPGG